MIVAAALLLACLIPVSAASVEFKDVSGHWAEEYILQAGERSLVQGYNGLYRPDDTMTITTVISKHLLPLWLLKMKHVSRLARR